MVSKKQQIVYLFSSSSSKLLRDRQDVYKCMKQVRIRTHDSRASRWPTKDLVLRIDVWPKKDGIIHCNLDHHHFLRGYLKENIRDSHYSLALMISTQSIHFIFVFLSLRVPAVVSINGGFYSALSPFNPRIIFYVCQQTDQTTHHRANLNRICICRTRFLIHFRTKRDNRRFKKIIMFNRKSKNYIHLPKYG